MKDSSASISFSSIVIAVPYSGKSYMASLLPGFATDADETAAFASMYRQLKRQFGVQWWQVPDHESMKRDLIVRLPLQHRSSSKVLLTAEKDILSHPRVKSENVVVWIPHLSDSELQARFKARKAIKREVFSSIDSFRSACRKLESWASVHSITVKVTC